MPPEPTRRFDLVICDNDGCLVDERNTAFDRASLGRIAEHNRLARERRDRPTLTVCSGRPLPFVESMCRLLDNLDAWCIAENGAWIYHPGTNEWELDPRLTDDHLGAIRDAEAWAARELRDSGVTIQPGKNAMVSLYHPNAEYVHRLVEDVRAENDRRGWGLNVSATVTYLNIDVEFVSKASGIDRVMARTGLTPDRLAGIGDTTGDLAIRKRVAWFGCPANAVDALKEHADAVARASIAAGVVELLGAISGTR